MNKALEINEMIKEDPSIKEYLKLKEEIKGDKKLSDLKSKLEKTRRVICKDRSADSSEYYALLEKYKSNPKVIRFAKLEKDLRDLLIEISDILSLK